MPVRGTLVHGGKPGLVDLVGRGGNRRLNLKTGATALDFGDLGDGGAERRGQVGHGP